jgi:hypothetical protein
LARLSDLIVIVISFAIVYATSSQFLNPQHAQ